jgi:NAD(P)-dependent dehydrogenase (short-subunit alcohol dehydrogenase family)
MTDLTGKVVVITGGNTGIGLGLAKGVARAGADVAIWARNQTRNAEAVEVLEKLGVHASAQPCDVSDEDQVERAMAGTLADHGKVDCLFANAGIYGDSAFVDMTLAEWRRVMAVNLDGAFLTLRAAARHMVSRGEGGSLVGVSSTSALFGAPRKEHYAVSKTGLVALMRSLAVELARYQIRANSLLPGWTDTELLSAAKENQKFVDATISRTPIRRWGTPEDFAEVAIFLADPAVHFHTGDTMVVDGGYSIF